MKTLTPLELDALEARLQHRIPAPYRELLTHTGAGGHGDVQVYHPLEIEEGTGPVGTQFGVAKARSGVPI